jgi:hypothetical protein
MSLRISKIRDDLHQFRAGCALARRQGRAHQRAWQPDNAIDGRFIWLPVLFRDETPFLEWRERWSVGALSCRAVEWLLVFVFLDRFAIRLPLCTQIEG